MKKILLRLFLLASCLGGVAAALFYSWLMRPLPFPDAVEQVRVRVPAGVGARGAARAMGEAGVPVEPQLFALAMRLYNWQNGPAHLKAGVYGLPRGVTPWTALSLLRSGRVLQMEVRLIEGRTFRQFRQTLEEQDGLTHELKTLSDAEVMARLGLPGASPEGRFFPDTYRVDVDASDLDVLRQAAKLMQQRLSQAWATRAANLPYRSPYEALIMASIVEKETGIDADRGKIASVFVNRLRLGMRLQTDPTVIYGLGAAFDGNLKRRDLEWDTPYNTYTRAGLPPTPIAMPGQASLFAALHPEPTRYLYFVARGDGSSAFSETLAAHNQAVNRYQRRR